jgi:hypothetical protein
MQPLIIEEFGKNVSSQDPATIAKERNPTFETVLAALNSSLESDDVLKAAQVKCWMVLAVSGQIKEGPHQHPLAGCICAGISWGGCSPSSGADCVSQGGGGT